MVSHVTNNGITFKVRYCKCEHSYSNILLTETHTTIDGIPLPL